MTSNLNRNKISWLLIALMALIASSIGVENQGIYGNLRNATALPAILSQDMIAVFASIVMLFLIIRIKEDDFIKQLVLFGIVGYLFYIYGLYVVGKMYNSLYILYMAIFSLSLFSLIYGIANMKNEAYDKNKTPRILQKVAAAFLFLPPVVFYPMWIIAMWPFMRDMQVPVTNVNVYILDMCFLLPACAMMAVMMLKRNAIAIFLAPVLLIKGFTLSLSVALSEMLRPFYNQTYNIPYALLFIFFMLSSLTLTILYFKGLRHPSVSVTSPARKSQGDKL